MPMPMLSSRRIWRCPNEPVHPCARHHPWPAGSRHQDSFEGVTDGDGRCPGLRELALHTGSYRLEFSVAAYFRNSGVVLPDPPFLDVVNIDFGMGADGHYHVPLLVSPFGYSTYRGS